MLLKKRRSGFGGVSVGESGLSSKEFKVDLSRLLFYVLVIKVVVNDIGKI